MPVKAKNLIAMLAEQTGIDFDQVTLHARRLREEGLFVRESRSPKCDRANPRHIANLLVMLLSEQPAGHCKKVIGQAEALEVDRIFLDQNARHFAGRSDALEIFSQAHSFMDALETLVALAIECPEDFDSDVLSSARFPMLSVTFDRQAFTGQIDLSISNQHENILERDVNWRALIHYHDIHRRPGRGASRDFLQQNVIEADLFKEIGRAFARGALEDAA